MLGIISAALCSAAHSLCRAVNPDQAVSHRCKTAAASLPKLQKRREIEQATGCCKKKKNQRKKKMRNEN
jgi:hypothetical protein